MRNKRNENVYLFFYIANDFIRSFYVYFMTPCKSCNKEHFIPSDSGLCLLCQMKSKKSEMIQKAKSAAIADYQKKTEIPLEPIEPVISIDDF